MVKKQHKKLTIYNLKDICLILILAIIFPAIAFSQTQQTIKINSYHPSPYGQYDTVRLFPNQSFNVDASDPCSNGTLFVSEPKLNQIFACEYEGWSGVSYVWEENTDNVYLSDLTNPELKRIGVGTSAPRLKLSLGSDTPGAHPADGGIISNSIELRLDGNSHLTYDSVNHNITFNNTNTFQGSHVKTNSGFIGGSDNTIQRYVDPIISTIVLGGKDNNNRGSSHVINGGQGHTAYSTWGFTGGGKNHTGEGGGNTTILGGEENWSGMQTFVGGGKNNQGNDATAFVFGILGGENNRVVSAPCPYPYCTPLIAIPGGGSTYAGIGGGENNTLFDVQSAVGGGLNNFVGYQVTYTPIGSMQLRNSIIGGEGNRIETETNSNTYTVIGGGYYNNAFDGFIGGGMSNIAGAGDADIKGYVGGGHNNQAIADNSFIGGGGEHNIYTTLTNNHIYGGFQNLGTIGGGYSNLSYRGGYIPGGTNNAAGSAPSGAYTYASGQGVRVQATNAFTFGKADSSDILVPNSNKFVIKHGPNTAYGGYSKVGFHTLTPAYALDVNGKVFIENGTIYIDNLASVSGSGVKPLRRKSIGTSPLREIGPGNDLAETFLSNEEVTYADVLILDSNAHDSTVIKSSQPYDSRVIGIASAAPAINLKDGQIAISEAEKYFEKGDEPPVALAGRVLCKVSLEGGAIDYGTPLTTSSLSGHAMAASNMEKSFNAVFAKALEPFDGGKNGEQTGMIKVLITKQ